MANYFDQKDIDLLESALALIPDLLPSVLIAKFVRENIPYPIKSIDVFKPYFKESEVLLEDKTIFTYDQAQRFFPAEFFPIETERDLLCRLLIAFQRGRFAHLLDKQHPPPEKDWPQGVEPTILPSPSFTIFDLVKLNQGT
jgi:hypothetical protein